MIVYFRRSTGITLKDPDGDRKTLQLFSRRQFEDDRRMKLAEVSVQPHRHFLFILPKSWFVMNLQDLYYQEHICEDKVRQLPSP